MDSDIYTMLVEQEKDRPYWKVWEEKYGNSNKEK